MSLREWLVKFKPKHDDELTKLEKKLMRQIGEETKTVAKDLEKTG
jgi:hypothetical protein